MKFQRTPTSQKVLTKIKKLRSETRSLHKKLNQQQLQPSKTPEQYGQVFGMTNKDFWDLVIKTIGLIALVLSAVQLILQYKDLSQKKLEIDRQNELDQKKYYQDLRASEEKKVEADRDYKLHESQFFADKLTSDRLFSEQQKEFGERLTQSLLLLEKNNQLTIQNKRDDIQKDIFLELGRCLAILTTESVNSEKYAKSMKEFDELKDGQIALLGDNALMSAVNTFSCYLNQYDWLGRTVTLSDAIYMDLQTLQVSRPREIFSMNMNHYPDDRDAITIARDSRYRDYFDTVGRKLQDMKRIYQELPRIFNPEPCVFNYDSTVYHSLDQPWQNYAIAYAFLWGGLIDSVKKYTMDFEDIIKIEEQSKVDSSLNFPIRNFANTVDSLSSQIGKISRAGDSVLTGARKIIVQQRDQVIRYLVRSSAILDNNELNGPTHGRIE